MEVTTWTEALRCKRVALGDSANAQAVTRVNAEQAPKQPLRKPTCREYGEGCQRSGSERREHRSVPPGYWRRHVRKRDVVATREAPSVACTGQPGIREDQLGPTGWRRGP